jgi:hypothetical protein
MPVTSNNITPPRTGPPVAEIPTPPVVTNPDPPSPPRVRGNVAITLSRSSRRMLEAAKCSEKRPELLAMFDFKPLYSSSGKRTLAGKMFKARVTARSQQLESIKDLLKNLEDELPDEFSAAVNQYVSTLASVSADVALLKLLILLRLYATHTARFLEFKDEYRIPENIDLSFLPGDDASQKINSMLKLSHSGMNNPWATATVPLYQILNDISLCSYALIPRSMITGAGMLSRTSTNMTGIAGEFPMKSRTRNPVYNLAFLTKDILASHEFMKLIIGDDVDEVFETLVAENLDSNFLSSNINVSFSAFTNLVGRDGWGWIRTSGETSDRFNEFTNKSIADLVNRTKGVLSKSSVNVGGVGHLLLPETTSQIFGGREYSNIDGFVDKAFSGTPPLDFTEFNEVIGDFTTSIKKLQTFGNTLFRMAEKKDDFAPGPRDFPLVADEMPFTLGSSGAAVLDVWNRRFLAVFKSSVYNSVDELMDQPHISFNRMIAWIIIRDDYEKAYGFVSAFISDWESGFLTAAGLPEEIVIDEETGETEFAATSFVLPGTTTPANLGTITTRLGGKLSSCEDFFEGLKSYDPIINIDARNNLPQPAGGSGHGGGMSYAIQTTKHDWTCGDLSGNDYRLVNPIYRYKAIGTEYTGKNWLGIKIIAAEVIDCVFEILRMVMAPIGEPEPVAEGDPIFPTLEHSKSPYGSVGDWSFCDPAYESFAMGLWVPTTEFFLENFTRKTSKTTYFRSATLRAHCKNILRMLSTLMGSTASEIKLCSHIQHEREWSSAGIGADPDGTKRYGFLTCTFKCPNDEHFEWPRYEDYWSQARDVVPNILDSTSWDDISQLDSPTSESSTTGGGRRWVNTRLNSLHHRCVNFLKTAHENDLCLEFMYSYLGSYADRVDGYNAAVQGLVAGENSALGTFSQQLLDAGDAGTDVLQNITPDQLALKQIALIEDRGDENNGYVPTLAILNKNEIKAVKIMATEPNATSPEGSNSKIVFVGMPAGIFDSLEIEDDFGIRVSYVDIEYPQIAFKPKVYPFKRDIYIMPDDLEGNMDSYNSLKDIVKNIRFTKLAVEVIESGDTAASIQIQDSSSNIRAYPPEKYPTYTNHLVSDLLKIYIRVMIGFNFNESAFLGNSEGIQTPINDYAADLAVAMAEGVNAMSSTSTQVGNTAARLLRGTMSIDTDDFVSGDLKPVDEALLVNLRDAFQTRLFSAEIMKSRVMSAKFFDRIFGLIVDPDEFYILAPGDVDSCGVTTPQKVLDFYLQKGIIEWVGNPRTGGYKLKPRTTAEGRMAFGKFFTSITSYPTNPDTAWEK